VAACTLILDVTRIDAQTLHLHRDRVVLPSIIERVRVEFEPALKERQLTLTIDDMTGVPLVSADPEMLYKVFYHLIVNAIKYTPDGGSITVSGQVIESCEGVEPSQDCVEVLVSDTGIGIDPAHHELIFEKFYQTGEVAVHSSGRTKFKGGGPGLGLAIARGIVLAHGGKIWVESEGHDEVNCPGSRFYVWLPLAGTGK
jgi:signal transduction histidine kinase